MRVSLLSRMCPSGYVMSEGQEDVLMCEMRLCDLNQPTAINTNKPIGTPVNIKWC